MTRSRRTGAITFGGLVGRLEVLRVTCSKCPRAGQYSLAADCPLRARAATWDLCGARFLDLPAVM
jgi:hypothetical protein